MDTVSSPSRASVTPPTVRLLADIACPWSYLTLVSLRRAFGSALRLEWHPFMLNPKDLARQRTRLLEAVNRYARQLDAPFRAGSLSQPIDSRLVHAVVLAAEADRVADVASTLFRGRFEAATALVDARAIQALLEAGLGAGVAAALMRESASRLEVVDRADRAARIAGVAEIPVSVLDDGYVIAGLQPPEAFLGLAELAATERRLKGEGG